MRRDRSLGLWHRCQRTVDELDLPNPFDATVLIGTLAGARGRPIELIPVASRPGTPCGVLVTTHRTDYILYAGDTTALHQQHIVLHEAAHIICGHHESAPAVAAAAQTLLPHLPASLVQRVLGRTVYAEPQEQEAELVASLILTRATRLARTSAAPAPADLQESRVQRLFGAPGRRSEGRSRG
ncbi:ParH-like protein [Streptomyces sp. NBC_01497]|uniref:ParH-like protein n=1 Tax=Streptomyces sp. NBC_01497 TaxID=2903885 RepID=UPI002E3313D8|nr:ParH-like protein [Streptomyces sp. NBC_01497]